MYNLEQKQRDLEKGKEIFMKKRRKVNLLVILSVFICLVFVTLNSVKFKFLLEVIKLSNTLPTISTDFYNDPIDDITYEDITYKKRNGLSLKLDLYDNNICIWRCMD